MTKIIKTIQWTAESKGLFALCARTCKLGTAINANPCNFVEFVAAYPNRDLKSLAGFFKRYLLNDRFKDHDVSDIATLTEDSCLFSTDGNAASALDIVLSYLKILNTGGRVPAFWCYLDEDKKAIVHFVNRQGFYAELYCLTNEDSSVIHLVDAENGYCNIIPVIFAKEFPKEVVRITAVSGNNVLHEYLPRERFDLLSKGGKKHSGFHLPEKAGAIHPRKISGADAWDSL